MDCRYERRVGPRVAVEALPVLWRVPPPDQGRHGRRRRRTACVQSGVLLDLSATGLKLRAPAADDLEVGSAVAVEIEGIVGTVIIRWITPVPGTPFCDYGVELASTATELGRWCHATLALNADHDELHWVVGRWKAAAHAL